MDFIRNWIAKRKTDERSTVFLLIKGYFVLILICFLLLLIPFCQNAQLSIVDHLFFAVSVVSTTGLVPADFASSYSLLGQVVCLFFIQLGGIGYMALSSFIILKERKRLPSISARLLRLEFNLPERYPLISFIYSVFVFTILIETVGAVILSNEFRSLGVDDYIWQGVFHSISAFCTAGFSLHSDSMVSFNGNQVINTTIMILSLFGSIGFIVLLDLWLKLIRKRKTITLTSKIILISTFAIWMIGAVFIFFSDREFIAMRGEGFMLAAFQSISAHTTAGFNNYDIGAISYGGVLIMIVLMIIGASPAGTGGGVKTTSIFALFAVLYSVLRRRAHITFFKSEIQASNVYLAISSGIFYFLILFMGVWALLLVDGHTFAFEDLIFEASSALSTVGISRGITGDLSDASKLIISFLMFIGRLGVLTFGFALISRAPLLREKSKVEDIAI
jgi:trk system potassium uptake protein TrkH